MEAIPFVSVDADGGYRELNVVTELVKGRKFVNSRGQKVCIGMTSEVQQLVGLPFEAFDRMEKEVRELTLQRNRIYARLNRIEVLTFWRRLKFLFRGYKYIKGDL